MTETSMSYFASLSLSSTHEFVTCRYLNLAFRQSDDNQISANFVHQFPS